MSAPKRIQLRRTKGWRKPVGATVVSRPGRWGNPFAVRRIDNDSDDWAVIEDGIEMEYFGTKAEALAGAVDFFRHERAHVHYPSAGQIRAELAGHDLACWCPLDQPCHADVLLELANGPAS